MRRISNNKNLCHFLAVASNALKRGGEERTFPTDDKEREQAANPLDLSNELNHEGRET